jgi:hypothetical protein
VDVDVGVEGLDDGLAAGVGVQGQQVAAEILGEAAVPTSPRGGLLPETIEQIFHGCGYDIPRLPLCYCQILAN